MWHLLYHCIAPTNPCNGSHVPWKQRLNAFSEWAFVVTNAVMNNLRNSAILCGLPPSPQDVLDQSAMIPTKGRAMCDRTVVRKGCETPKENQLTKNKLTPSMKSSSIKSHWLCQRRNKRPLWYELSHIPELLCMPVLKSYQDWPVSAQLFWSEQRQTAHAAEQRFDKTAWR